MATRIPPTQGSGNWSPRCKPKVPRSKWQTVRDSQAVNVGKKPADCICALVNTGFFSYDDHSDATHPNDVGYEKMASVWATAFKKVEKKGWLVPPIDTGGSDDSNCYPSASGFRGPVQTQQGSGYSDGDYAHSSSLDNTLNYYGAAPRSLVNLPVFRSTYLLITSF